MSDGDAGREKLPRRAPVMLCCPKKASPGTGVDDTRIVVKRTNILGYGGNNPEAGSGKWEEL